ncbi:unnamed protein product [Phaeothamnion confervicola]
MDAAKPLEGNLTVTVIEAQGLGKPEVFGEFLTRSAPKASALAVIAAAATPAQRSA